MNMVNLLNDANSNVEQARRLIKGSGKEDAHKLAKNLTASRELLMQHAHQSVNDQQQEMAKLLKNIETVLKMRSSRQSEEQVGIQAVQVVLRALTELQKTVEKIKSDSEKQKRTISKSHGSNL